MTDQTASDRKILTRSKPDQFIICLHEDILGHIIYKRRYLVAFQVIQHQLKNRIGRRDQWETPSPRYITNHTASTFQRRPGCWNDQ